MMRNEKTSENIKHYFETLSTQDFLNLGMEGIAYIRAANAGHDNGAYTLYAANGTKIVTMKNRQDLEIAALQNGLRTMTLQ